MIRPDLITIDKRHAVKYHICDYKKKETIGSEQLKVNDEEAKYHAESMTNEITILHKKLICS